MLPIVSSELVDRIRRDQALIEKGARELLHRARLSGDSAFLGIATTHYQELTSHLGLVDALLDALVIDDPTPKPTRRPRAGRGMR